MFRAPFDSFHASPGAPGPPFVDQLLSEESLRKTSYFEPSAVALHRQAFRAMRPYSPQRVLLEMGLVGVIATQLWHQTFIDGSLADLPNLANRPSSLVNGQGPRRRGFAPTVMH